MDDCGRKLLRQQAEAERKRQAKMDEVRQLQKKRNEELRKLDTHWKIVLGGTLKKYIPDSEVLTTEDVDEILRLAFKSNTVTSKVNELVSLRKKELDGDLPQATAGSSPQTEVSSQPSSTAGNRAISMWDSYEDESDGDVIQGEFR